MRWAEFGLFLSPFALFAIWWFVSVRLRPAALALLCAAVVALAASTVWFGLSRRAGPGAYVPAQWVNGRIVPGRAD